MQVLQDHPLKTLNSLNVQAIARQYVQVYSLDHIREWCQSDGVHKQKYFVLGGGTNTLFVGDFEGTILHVNLKGIEVIKQDEEDVTIKVRSIRNSQLIISYYVFYKGCSRRALG